MRSMRRNGYGVGLAAAVVLVARLAGSACGEDTRPATPGGAVAAALAPITLNLKGATLQQTADALTKATGANFSAGRDTGRGRDDGGGEKTFSLEGRGKTLWEAYELLAQQGEVDLLPNQQGMALIPRQAQILVLHVPPAENGARNSLIAVGYEAAVGPLLIRAGTERLPFSAFGGNTPDDPARPKLTVAAIADPRLIASPVAFKILEVMDENGKKLGVDGVQSARLGIAGSSGAWQPHDRDYTRVNYWVWQASLTLPEGHGKALARAKGEVVLAVAQNAVLELDDATEKHANEVNTVGGWEFTLQSLTAAPSGQQTGVKLEFTMTAAKDMEGASPPRVEVIDAEGRVLMQTTAAIPAANMPPRQGQQLTVAECKVPLKVVVKAPTKMEEVTVPFEVKGLPLP